VFTSITISNHVITIAQVALDRTRPGSSVIGIDLIPAQPPRGVAAFQGDFLSSKVQLMVKSFILQVHKQRKPPSPAPEEMSATAEGEPGSDDIILEQPSYIDMERHAAADSLDRKPDQKPTDYSKMNLVDVVLSDMSEPWDQTTGFGSNTLSNPYIRLMNTSGNTFRDHAGSMDLCNAALQFASDTLKPGGHFVCKFYQGAEDKVLERKLQTLFSRVHRDKPEASRKVRGTLPDRPAWQQKQWPWANEQTLLRRARKDTLLVSRGRPVSRFKARDWMTARIGT
jgi:21S rRNA (uridine2791-2'-O)-methyltransferase